MIGMTLVACGNSGNNNDDNSSTTAEVGQWTVGDLHSHTTQSDDAHISQALDLVLDNAFSSYKLDWLAVSNHLRSPAQQCVQVVH